jgi:hypothetical protein
MWSNRISKIDLGFIVLVPFTNRSTIQTKKVLTIILNVSIMANLRQQ